MQTIKAHTSLSPLRKSRQLAHHAARHGHFVRIEVVGDIQVKAAGRFAKAEPLTKFLWAKLEDVLALKDARVKPGRPLKVTETYKGRARTLTIKTE